MFLHSPGKGWRNSEQAGSQRGKKLEDTTWVDMGTRTKNISGEHRIWRWGCISQQGPEGFRGQPGAQHLSPRPAPLSPWLGVPSCVWPFVAPWTLAGQAPLSMDFSRQEYWSGLPFPSPGDLPSLGIEPCLLCLLCWQVGSLPYRHLGRCY